MIIFADNDILLKLISCQLLNSFLEIINVRQQDITISNSAFFSLPSQAKKLKNEQLIADIDSFIKHANCPGAIDNNDLKKLEGIKYLDSGEVHLILAAYRDATSYLATGDKRCLLALKKYQNHPDISPLHQSLQKRVYCTESVFILLIEHMGFTEVNRHILHYHVQDGVLKMAFGNGRDKFHAIECLRSYSQDIADFLV